MGISSKFLQNKIAITSEPTENKEKMNYIINSQGEEEKICAYFIEILSKNRNANKFKVEHRSQDYTSLVYGNNDFMRVKFTHASKWISFSLSEDDRSEYHCSPLFDLTPKKSSLHWKASINSFDDLSKFIQIAEHSCYELRVLGSDHPTEEEKVICNYIKELLLSMGARENYITYHHFDSYAKTNYCGRDIFKFKILKSKANYAMLENDIAKKAKLNLDTKQHLTFTSVDDLKNTPGLTVYVKLQLERFKNLEGYYDCMPK